MLLIHLAEGCSLRETAVRAREGDIIAISDVAIMDRLRQAGDWFCWMSTELMKEWVAIPPTRVFGTHFNVRLVDATRIQEPGPTGSTWCIHYAIGLPSLVCDDLIVTDKGDNGESFRKFRVNTGDLMIGDRAYGVAPGISYVHEKGGDVLVRFSRDNLPLYETSGRRFDLLEHLRTLKGTQVGDWPVQLHGKSGSVSGRVCAIKKSRQAAEKARRQVKRKGQKGGHKVKPQTYEAAGYTFVFTTVARDQLRPRSVLEIYRGRWRIELVFKRLKSILVLGHLRKYDPDAARSWIHGKLLIALLIEALLRSGESFFPLGVSASRNITAAVAVYGERNSSCLI